MQKYHISPTDSHRMFIESIHQYLIRGSLFAILISAVTSFMIMRRMLGPLTRMMQMTKKIAAGDFSDEIPVSTGDEVGQLAEAFNRMTESLKHIEQLRKNMIVDVAHELKTPLTNIQGYLEALTDGVVPPTPETIALLQEETQRLAHLVSDILQLSRSGGAKISLDILKIRLLDAGNHLLEIFRLKLAEKNIDVDCRGITPACWVHADPLKLAQVLHNLFQNALQYTRPGGRLRLFAEALPRHPA